MPFILLIVNKKFSVCVILLILDKVAKCFYSRMYVHVVLAGVEWDNFHTKMALSLRLLFTSCDCHVQILIGNAIHDTWWPYLFSDVQKAIIIDVLAAHEEALNERFSTNVRLKGVLQEHMTIRCGCHRQYINKTRVPSSFSALKRNDTR